MSLPSRGACAATALLTAAAFAQDGTDPPTPSDPPATVLPAVTVSGTARDDGSAAAGYRSVEAQQLGPLGALPLAETPYSLNVVPQALIENLQASRPDDVYRINPVVQLTSPQSRFFTGVTVRGFGLGSTKRIDGIPVSSSYVNVDLEDKERIEVLTGLSGFLYGMGNVGGTLNYVLKRPTPTRQGSVTLGLTEGRNLRVHGDVGGPIDEAGRLAYRLNVVGQDGDGAYDQQSTHRSLVSGAVDWHLGDRLTLQFDASRSRYRMRGTEPYWSAAAGVRHPAAPDVDAYWGQPWTSTRTAQDRLGARLHWQATDDLAVRIGYAEHRSAMDLVVANNTFVDGLPGAYEVRSSAWEYPDVRSRGGFALLDWTLRTGPVLHQITAGWYGDRDRRTNFRGSGWSTDVVSGFDTRAPGYFDPPSLPVSGARYVAQRTRNDNLVLGDRIEFSPAWSALVGLSRVRIDDRSFDDTGATAYAYGERKLTPTLALIHKPRAGWSVYGSYVEGLEPGGQAAPTYNDVEVVNAGAVMPPLKSHQFELGSKLELGGTLLTAALFRIDKGFEYYDLGVPTAPVYVQDGRQVHDGVELTATGRATKSITVLAGLTWLNARITKNQADPGLEGKTPVDVAERQAKLYLEYDLAAVPGLTLTGGVYYTGPQFVDELNTERLPSFTLLDAGARYALPLGGHPLTLRLQVSNLANRDYWLSSHYVGRPRTVSVSAQLAF